MLTLLLLVGGACDGQTGETSDGNEPARQDKRAKPAGGTSQPNQASTSDETRTFGGQTEGDSVEIPAAGTVSVDQALGVLSQLSDTSDTQVAAQPPTSDGTQEQSIDAFMQAVGADVDAFWAQLFGSWNNTSAAQCQYDPSQGASDQYDPSQCPVVSTTGQFSYGSPPLTLFSGSIDTGPCGEVSQSVYCFVEGSQGVYIERGEAQEAYTQINDTDGADFAVAFLLAHEYGHHVQAELGYFDPNNAELVQTFEERSVPFEN
jgi:predicted metalloprotease